ncbi:hypothetical protein A2696_01825 [Candidatus Curtissbacteria bacterium RIFCSPHIGHO2_01_FULL_41_13]|uniref:Uncharacterized protein n=1 Tax=Candidatus Curtissbacteria bacterium RIFCSPHIGHO2_01_FULL_41_13 TaxID=1797745 RepID=A0A1F5G1M1_9BACT|nr:MAG: hypothetical protein A2696_01825 [Candidatus Curtissbacteria bacterium RIFCSPHIGHO2_01_FULL_41_13]
MPDRPPTADRPLYTPIEFMGFQEWADSGDIRVQRIREFITPRLAEAVADLADQEAAKFMRTAIQQLEDICQRRFTDQGNPPSEIPIYCLLDGKINNHARYNFDGIRGEHNGPTLIVTQALIHGLCPEFDVKLVDDLEESLRKAGTAQNFGYADLHSHYTNGQQEAAEYSTVLPGVTLSVSHHNEEKYISLDWKVM